MSTEIIEFYAQDGAILNGYINKCQQPTKKVLVQIHGMTSNCFKKREKIIAEQIEKIDIDSICINTRGSDIVRYLKYRDGKKVLAGTAFEDVEESYYDILGAIDFALNNGYSEIYLQGHSLGATKVTYAYSKMQKENNEKLKYIKGILLLSLVDVTEIMNSFVTPELLKYVENKEKENKIYDFLPFIEGFFNPMSVKTALKYLKYNQNFNFAQYSNKNFEFKVLNDIQIPLFMRWGDTHEMIRKTAEDQVNFMNSKIKNPQKDINFIKDANHSYNGKELQLANEIVEFLS